MPTLNPLDSVYISTVVEDCVDQLLVLGRIMPVTYEGRSDAGEIVDGEIGRIVDSQRQLESKYESLVSKRSELQTGGKGAVSKLKETEAEMEGVLGGLRASTQTFAKSLKQSPLTSDNLTKMQADRQFLENVMAKTLKEVLNFSSFACLVESVEAEREKKESIREIILKEEAGRKRVRQLQRQLVEVKKEQESAIQERKQMIAHLKDQLQEMKAKTNMEGKYVKKNAEVSVNQNSKKCFISEKDLREECEKLKVQIEEEKRVHEEIENYLKAHQTELKEKVEYWMEKYEKDVDVKQHELDVLKASKANDLAKLQELTKTYKEYESVVVEDRIEKEKLKRKAEQEIEELKSVTKVQSWWRGIMVRNNLGPYSKKKKKGKKGKSGKKKKKK